MMSIFPTIKCLNDIRPALCPEIKAVEHPNGVTVVAYKVLSADLFPSDDPELLKLRRECRGLVFDTASGKILRRPLHKFFNVNERPEYAETMLSDCVSLEDQIALEKLDGSMVSPYLEPGTGRIVWGTKAGETEISAAVVEFVKDSPYYEEFVRNCIDCDYTPVFEWTSPNFPIVVRYKHESLTLTAIRHMHSGKYDSYGVMDYCSPPSMPVVARVHLDQIKVTDIVEHVRKGNESEGIVIRYKNGDMVKIKTEWYVGLHRITSKSNDPRVLFAACFNQTDDDILSQLPKDLAEKVAKYFAAARSAFEANVEHLESLSDMARASYTRAEFAKAEGFDDYWRALVFHMWDRRQSTRALLHRQAIRAANSKNAVRRYSESILNGIMPPRLMFGEDSDE